MSKLSKAVERLITKYDIDPEVLLEITLAGMEADVKIVDLKKEVDTLKQEVENLRALKGLSD